MREKTVSDEMRKKVGRALNRLRTMAEMSQVKFATMAGVPAGTIALVESESKALPAESAEKIAAACGCSAAFLQRGEVRAMAGGEFTKAIFSAWRATAPDAEQLARGADAVAFKTGLILRTLAARGRFLWGAARIDQLLADVAGEAGLTQHDVEAVARAGAAVSAVSLTVGDVARNPEHDLYHAVQRCGDMGAPIVGTVETWASVPVPTKQGLASGGSRRCSRWSVSVAGGAVGVIEAHKDAVDVAFPGVLIPMGGGGASGSLALPVPAGKALKLPQKTAKPSSPVRPAGRQTKRRPARG